MQDDATYEVLGAVCPMRVLGVADDECIRKLRRVRCHMLGASHAQLRKGIVRCRLDAGLPERIEHEHTLAHAHASSRRRSRKLALGIEHDNRAGIPKQVRNEYR